MSPEIYFCLRALRNKKGVLYCYAREVRAPPAADHMGEFCARGRFCLFELVGVSSLLLKLQ